MTANALARRIADILLAQKKDRPDVPPVGTLGDLLRDYERAKVNELLEGEKMMAEITKVASRARGRPVTGTCPKCGAPTCEDMGREACSAGCGAPEATLRELVARGKGASRGRVP